LGRRCSIRRDRAGHRSRSLSADRAEHPEHRGRALSDRPDLGLCGAELKPASRAVIAPVAPSLAPRAYAWLGLIASISATAPTYPGFASGLSGYPDKAGRGSGRGRTHIDNVISERVEFAVEPGGRTHVESYSSMMQGPVQRPTSPVCGGESRISRLGRREDDGKLCPWQLQFDGLLARGGLHGRHLHGAVDHRYGPRSSPFAMDRPFERCLRLDRRRLSCRPGVVSDISTLAISDHADRQHCT